jgi:hypothetical protein
MPDQRTVNRSTVDTSDHDLVEPDAPERDITERDVREPDASDSETSRERADMVGVAEPSEEPTYPNAASDSAVDSRDAEAAQDADAQMESPDGSRDVDVPPVAEASTPVETPRTTPDGAPTDPSGATQESGPDNAAELAPGDVPAPESTTLWAGEDSEALRERWRELQSRFVDDPRGAAAAADDLIGEAVDSITRDLAEQRRQLGQWRAGGDFDTERLRVAVTGYRDFLDRVLSI